jgi:hypothetical protein
VVGVLLCARHVKIVLRAYRAALMSLPAAACEDHTKSLLRAEPAGGMGVPPAADRHNWFARLRHSSSSSLARITHSLSSICFFFSLCATNYRPNRPTLPQMYFVTRHSLTHSPLPKP